MNTKVKTNNGSREGKRPNSIGRISAHMRSLANLHIGARKVAPVDMRKEETQFAIDGYLVDEVLNQLPAGIKILGANLAVFNMANGKKLPIPNALRMLGVSYMRNSSLTREIRITFDEVRPSTIRSNVKQICSLLGIDYEKAYFKYIVLGDDESAGMFVHCTKEIRPDETDQRKKLRVLGLRTAQGRIQSLMQKIGAKKFKCSFREETVRLMMCSRD